MSKWRKAVIVVGVLALVAAGLSRLKLETDVFALLPKNLPEVQAILSMRAHFVQRDSLIINVETSNGDQTRKATASLAAALEQAPNLVKKVRWSDVFENGETATALLAWALQNSDPAKLENLRHDLEPDKVRAHLDQIMDTLATSPDPSLVQRLSYDPLGLTNLLDMNSASNFDTSGFQLASADGTLRLLFVEPAKSPHGYKEAGKWLADLRQLIRQWQEKEGFQDAKIGFTGEPAFLAEIGGDIEHDMSSTMGLTMGLIGLLFWLMHRRVRPLLWMVLLLAATLGLTFSMAGLFLGKVSIMSMGFATIVLGIVVDYAVLVYQSAADHPNLGPAALRRQVMPSILSGAGTASAVFFALLFSSFPGMGELGILVGTGVLIGATLMLGFFPIWAAGAGRRHEAQWSRRPPRVWPAAIGTVVLIVGVLAILILKGWSGFDGSSAALRPRHSQAMDAFEHLEKSVGRPDAASIPMIVSAPANQLKSTLDEAAKILAEAKDKGIISDFLAAGPLAPQERFQEQNRVNVEWLIHEQPRLDKAVLDAGFTADALRMYHMLTKDWADLLAAHHWPTKVADHPAGDLLGRFVSDSDPSGNVMLGSVTLEGTPATPNLAKLGELQAWLRAHPQGHVQLAGWEALGPALSATVQRDFFWQTFPLLVVLCLMLWLVFRDWRDFSLVMFLLVFGAGMLVAAMTLIHHPWNLTSLAALPLHLGTGIDYGIYMLLAMRRENQDIKRVRGTTGRAVFFCGAANIIGFSSLLLANNQGIFSLGLACSIGLLNVLTLSLVFMPHWRRWLGGNPEPSEESCGVGESAT